MKRAAERPRDVARVELDAVAELAEPPQAVEEPACALVRFDGQVRAGRVPDEERVPGQDEPRLLGARPVGDGEGAVLRPVAGRVDDPNGHVPQLQHGAVLERLERELGLRSRVDGDRGVGLERQAAVAGDVVGVRVRLEDALDADVPTGGLLEVRLDRVGRIDDDRDASMLVADEVRAATEPLVHELTEEHAPTLPVRSAHFLEVMAHPTP